MEPALPYHNPYAEPAEAKREAGTEAETTDHPGSAPVRERFSKAAIIGMVIVTLGWVLALLPLNVWISSFGHVGSGLGIFLNIVGFLGIFSLVVSLVGFTATLQTGNRKRAARLYIIPSLLWQLPMAALIGGILFLLSTYEAT